MKKPQWVDTSSRSRGQVDRTPTSWELGVGHLSAIRVHRHVSQPLSWFVTCYALRLEQFELKSTDVEEAKKEALLKVGDYLKDYVNYYKKLGIET